MERLQSVDVQINRQKIVGKIKNQAGISFAAAVGSVVSGASGINLIKTGIDKLSSTSFVNLSAESLKSQEFSLHIVTICFVAATTISVAAGLSAFMNYVDLKTQEIRSSKENYGK